MLSKLKKLIFIFLIIVGLLPIIAQFFGLTNRPFACDFITQIVPLIFETKKMIASGVPLWSWNSFLGDNFIGANNFYVFGSPFTLICCLFPFEYIGIGVLMCLIFQYALYAIASMLYFRRMGFNYQISGLGALMYTFSSYCICAMFYFNFATGIILFPILLICIENLIDRRKFSLVLLSGLIGIMIICNFYFAALNLLGGGIYFLFRLVYSNSEKKVKRVCVYVLAVTLGVLLSSILFVPTVLCTFGSERSSVAEINLGVMDVVYFAIIKIVYILMPRLSEGTEAIYQPYSSFALYIPCIGFCFVVDYFRKNWKSWLTGLIICYLIILLSPLNIVMAIGANMFYGRWCYIILLVCILASLYVIKDNEISPKTVVSYVGISVAILLVLFFYLRRINAYFTKGIDEEVLFELAILSFGSITLILVSIFKDRLRVLYASVVLIGVSNLFIYSYLLVNRDKDGDYNQIMNNSCHRNQNDEFQYRADVSSRERNIGYVLNKGVPSQFHSVFNKSIMDLGRCFRSGTVPSISITHHRRSFNALVSVKEIIVYKGDTIPSCSSKILKNTDSYTVYENADFIPIGFAYDSFITEEDLKLQIGGIDYEKPENNQDVGLGMLQTLVVSKENASELRRHLMETKEIDFGASLDSVVNSRKKYTAVDFVGDTKGFTAHIDNRSGHSMVYFFSVPNDPGFTARLDGNRELKIYRANLGMMAVVVPPGNHSIDFRYVTPGLKIGALLSLIGLIISAWIVIQDRKRKTPKAENVNVIEQ